MSLEEFSNWEPEIEVGIKYEWDNGILEAADKLRTDELYIYRNLQREFYAKSKYSHHGSFITEVNVYLKEVNKLRRPDIVYFLDKEVEKAKGKKENIIPEMVMEIVSNSNSINEVEGKIRDYFRSGIKLVWIIFPDYKEVKIYHSIKNIQVCNGNDVCEFGDVIPDFQITVEDLFK